MRSPSALAPNTEDERELILILFQNGHRTVPHLKAALVAAIIGLDSRPFVYRFAQSARRIQRSALPGFGLLVRKPVAVMIPRRIGSGLLTFRFE